jgi:hypothetical protein
LFRRSKLTPSCSDDGKEGRKEGRKEGAMYSYIKAVIFVLYLNGTDIFKIFVY